MTKVHFLHNAQDRLEAATGWLSRAWSQRLPVLVYAPNPQVADQVDQLLWVQPATGFTPHCRLESPLAAETPILIASVLDALGPLPQEGRMLNLSDEVPPGFARFEKLFEVVGQQDDERNAARKRAKFYKDRGYDVEFHDLSRAKDAA